MGGSNLDAGDMRELLALPGGSHCAASQVLYHLAGRGIEYDLLPMLWERGIPVMAYCPLAQAGRLGGGLTASPTVQKLAHAHGADPAQILLAFLLARPGVVPIPRSGKAHHTRQNARAAAIRLAPDELAMVDRAFPPPRYKIPRDIV